MAKELAISKSLNVKGYSSPNIFDNGLGVPSLLFLAPFRLGRDYGIILKNCLITNPRPTKKSDQKRGTKKMRKTKSAFFCEQRQMHQSAPLLKNRSPSLVVFFIRKMKRAN